MSFTYFISSDKMGSQDPQLGHKLMRNFFIKLLTSFRKPSHIIFVERGVSLLASETPVLNALEILENEYQVGLLACATCLDFYNIRDELRVGKISSMPEIIELMHNSDKVIHL